MPHEPDEAVSHWLEALRAGDSQAAQRLWDHYFERLVAVAHGRLRHMANRIPGDDIALSALKSVMIGVREKRFPDVRDRDSLWPLLVSITARKAVTEQRRALAQKRSVVREALVTDEQLQNCIGTEPTPEFAAAVTDELEHLVDKLGDDRIRRVATMTLEGYSQEEIAAELHCSLRTVVRKLQLIRLEWVEE